MVARSHRTPEQAETLLRGTGARVTQPRAVVLAVLLDAGRALSHQEVHARVADVLPADRVTVYRVLDWLTAQGLAHKVAGADRVWRYTAVAAAPAHEHPHFQCRRCGTVTCLEDALPEPPFRLPRGYRRTGTEVTVQGYCAGCRTAPADARRR